MTRARDLSRHVNNRMRVFKYTATDGQLTFTDSDDAGTILSYDPNALMVTYNGVVLEQGSEYTASNGTSIVLADSADLGAEVNVIAFDNLDYSGVMPTSGGIFSGPVTFNNSIVGHTTHADSATFTGPVSFTNGSHPVEYSITLDSSQDQIGSFMKVNVNPGGDIGNEAALIEWSFTDENPSFTPQLQIGAEVGNRGATDAGIPSEGRAAFVVRTGRATAADGTGTIEEAFRVHYDGYAQSQGGVVNVTGFKSTAGTNVTTTSDVVIAASNVTVTKRGLGQSTFIYHIVLSHETDGQATNTNGFARLEYNVGGGWVATNIVIVFGGMSDYDGGTANNSYTLAFTPPEIAKSASMDLRLMYSKSNVQSTYFNQQALGSQPSGTSNYCSGFVMEIGAY